MIYDSDESTSLFISGIQRGTDRIEEAGDRHHSSGGRMESRKQSRVSGITSKCY